MMLCSLLHFIHETLSFLRNIYEILTWVSNLVNRAIMVLNFGMFHLLFKQSLLPILLMNLLQCLRKHTIS